MSTPVTGADPFTLLRTKLHKPQVSPNLVLRPRLVKRLSSQSAEIIVNLRPLW